jgi:hypothetical protein
MRSGSRWSLRVTEATLLPLAAEEVEDGVLPHCSGVIAHGECIGLHYTDEGIGRRRLDRHLAAEPAIRGLTIL